MAPVSPVGVGEGDDQSTGENHFGESTGENHFWASQRWNPKIEREEPQNRTSEDHYGASQRWRDEPGEAGSSAGAALAAAAPAMAPAAAGGEGERALGRAEVALAESIALLDCAASERAAAAAAAHAERAAEAKRAAEAAAADAERAAAAAEAERAADVKRAAEAAAAEAERAAVAERPGAKTAGETAAAAAASSSAPGDSSGWTVHVSKGKAAQAGKVRWFYVHAATRQKSWVPPAVPGWNVCAARGEHGTGAGGAFEGLRHVYMHSRTGAVSVAPPAPEEFPPAPEEFPLPADGGGA